MTTSRQSFEDLLRRTREGDERAAGELMERYEPHVRRAIRLRMRDRGLRQFLDSVDISQSVMGVFFNRFQSGDFAVESPNQLIALLVRMAQNRVTDWVRHGQAQKHDYRKQVSLIPNSLEHAGSTQSTSAERQVEISDLMAEVKRRLNPEERRLLDRRINAESWESIARAEGRSADALRTQLRRALRQVATEIGIL